PAPLPWMIAPGTSASVDVTFAPSALGNRLASLSFTDSAPGSPQSVALNGIGIGPTIQFSNPSISFGDQLLNTASDQKTVTITNSGTADLVISSITKSGAQAADFSLTAATPITIAAGTSANFTLTFTPSALGTRAASLSVVHNAPGSPA